MNKTNQKRLLDSMMNLVQHFNELIFQFVKASLFQHSDSLADKPATRKQGIKDKELKVYMEVSGFKI